MNDISPIPESPLRCVSLVLDNDRSRIPQVVQRLLDECQSLEIFGDAERFKVGVALEEALVNAIVHGNLEVSSLLREMADDTFERMIEQRLKEPQYSQRQVQVRCRFTSEFTEFEITDEGGGFDASSLPDPTDDENLDRPCGRGILLMRAFMDEVRFNDRGNRVTLVKRRSM